MAETKIEDAARLGLLGDQSVIHPHAEEPSEITTYIAERNAEDNLLPEVVVAETPEPEPESPIATWMRERDEQNREKEEQLEPKLTPELQASFDRRIQRELRKLRKQYGEQPGTEVAERKAEQQNGQPSQPANGAESSGHGRRVAEARARYSDWDETFNRAARDNIQIPETAIAVAKELDNGAEVAYLLAKHPDIAGEMLKNPAGAPDMVRQISAKLKEGHGGNESAAPRFASQKELEQHVGWGYHKTRVDESFKKEPLTRGEQHAASKMALPTYMGEAIIALPNSADVVRHIVRNPEIYNQWTRMSASAVLTEIGQISAQLRHVPAKALRPAPPEPITPVGGGSSKSSRQLEELPISEYMRARDSGRQR